MSTVCRTSVAVAALESAADKAARRSATEFESVPPKVAVPKEALVSAPADL